MSRTLVIIPTYNEAENIVEIIDRVHASVPTADVLVVDDNSPDGTGSIADELAGGTQVYVLHRSAKEGLGAAYVAGFGWGLARGYDRLVEMDADGSHLPEQLPALLANSGQGADLVIGSRWVPGGSVQNWPRHREILSRGANLYARIALKIPVRDSTGGYRVFRRATLLGINLDEIQSQGYCFQIDLTRRALDAGFSVSEVPIRFVERVRGESKMSGPIVREALWRVTAWGVGLRYRRLRSMLRRG